MELIIALAACLGGWLWIRKKNKKIEEANRTIAKNQAILQESERARKTEEEKSRGEATLQKKKIEYLQAKLNGEDVCDNCETINPTRCKCGTCISSSGKCGGTFNSSNECERCYTRRKRRECAEAEMRGIDVCWNCLTVRPDRCYCGNCTDWRCHGGGGGECCSCAD